MTFDFYRNVFHGQIIQEDDFLRLAQKARLFIRSAAGSLDIPRETLLYAVCSVAEIIRDEEILLQNSLPDKNAVAKESVGDYSVTYSSANPPDSLLSTLERKKIEALKSYLAPLPQFAGLFSVRSFPCSHHIR